MAHPGRQRDGSTYRNQNIRDNTLDNAQLETRCPLDNMRSAERSIPACQSAGQLDQLPAELLIKVVLYLDVPSLTDFRRVNRRAMDIVDSVPQYVAIIKHCPNIVRAILSIKADSFDCNVLYKTLCTFSCSTCERFGDYLYLIDCRRVCYLCFTRRLEYFPLTIGRASSLITHDMMQRCKATSGRQYLRVANIPRIQSLPGEYCTAWAGRDGGNSVRKRLQLFDRGSVIRDVTSGGLPKIDNTTREPLRYMTIITAPYLIDFGRQADWGSFCVGCQDELKETGRHYRTKYTREGISEHITRYGPVKEMPRTKRCLHVKPNRE
ncbi:hypothetical protein E4U13_007583 [Claviceps humidiphila]|uniref:F-box domain-containing protein n=1 Tax=Claviceps humidiphila TaxID=1294629 RepID=A0A9P7PTT5_9HYPO|nr:hypothetical protein E4U13_007583 [Claviceps humidiphila]